MVFVGERRSEERHDAVAQHLADCPLIAMDGFHHPLQNGSRILRASSGSRSAMKFHRPFQIGEQNGDLLALAFKRGSSDVRIFSVSRLPGVAFRYGDKPRAGRFLRQRPTADVAGVVGGNIDRSAGRTADLEARATFPAELSARRVIVTTAADTACRSLSDELRRRRAAQSRVQRGVSRRPTSRGATSPTCGRKARE